MPKKNEAECLGFKKKDVHRCWEDMNTFDVPKSKTFPAVPLSEYKELDERYKKTLASIGNVNKWNEERFKKECIKRSELEKAIEELEDEILGMVKDHKTNMIYAEGRFFDFRKRFGLGEKTK